MDYYMCKNKRTCTQFLFCTFSIFKVSYVLIFLYIDPKQILIVLSQPFMDFNSAVEIWTHITPILLGM